MHIYSGAEFQGYGTSVNYMDLLQEDGSISTGSHYYGEGYLISSTGLQFEIEGGLASTNSLAEDGAFLHPLYGWAGLQ